MSTIYYTGCSLDGFIATPDHSLDWLFSRDIDMTTTRGATCRRTSSRTGASSR